MIKTLGLPYAEQKYIIHCRAFDFWAFAKYYWLVYQQLQNNSYLGKIILIVIRSKCKLVPIIESRI